MNISVPCIRRQLPQRADRHDDPEPSVGALVIALLALWDLFAKTTLTPHEQQVVYITSNFENECHYCMAGHTALAKMQKMVPAVIDALRNGTEIPDRKLEALHRFTALVVRNRGWVSDADTDTFLAAGYTRRNVLEVILGVATKVMSNYTNHIAHTQLDKFMHGNEWVKRAARDRRPSAKAAARHRALRHRYSP